MLSLGKYVWKCIVGTELVYFGCLLYGTTLSGERAKLHHSLLELLPLFKWGEPSHVVMTAICMALMAGLFGWYMVWMHNSSME